MTSSARALVASMLLALLGAPYAAAGEDPATEEALRQTEAFLNDAKARADWAKGNPDAEQVNAFVAAFPPDAQNELMAIVMLMLKESQEGALKHHEAYKKGGVDGAMKSFSPAVKARVDALIAKLSKDPAFADQKRLQAMRTAIPAFLAAGAGS
jgi:hypothetical protein